MSSKSQNRFPKLSIIQIVRELRQQCRVRRRAIVHTFRRSARRRWRRDLDTDLLHSREVSELVEPRCELRNQESEARRPRCVRKVDSQNMIAYVRHLALGPEFSGEERTQRCGPRVAIRRVREQSCETRAFSARKQLIDSSVGQGGGTR